LLEVLIALSIMAVSLLILVSTQSSAARMTVQADRILIGTMLAKQKLSELEIALEAEDGFSEQDSIEEQGDFEQTFPGQYPEYRWTSRIQKLDMSGASTGGFSSLLGMDGESTQVPGAPEQPDLADFVNMDEISEQLARFIREVRVTVTWGEVDDGDEVTLTLHVIKPSGPAFSDNSSAPVDTGGDDAGSGGGKSAGGSRGSSSGIRR